jgi:hypothetical protein
MSQTIAYCIDSSALIELGQHYPRKHFPGIWQELSLLVAEERVLAPREVLKEVENDSELSSWVKQNREMFKALTAEQIDLVKAIQARFPDLIDASRETPDADPFLIALAVAMNRQAGEELFRGEYVVLTCERPTKQHKPRIPDVCKAYNQACISGARALTEMIAIEGWEFHSSRPKE